MLSEPKEKPESSEEIPMTEKSSVPESQKNILTELVRPGPDVPKICSCRWVFCYFSCVAMMFVYAVRVDISVAIVCMVRKKYKNDSMHSNDSECQLPTKDHTEHQAEFEWPEALVANVLGGFFYGYTISNIPGGILADKFGGKRVFGTALMLAGILTILHPAVTRVSGYLTLAIRICTGLVSGPLFPSMHSIWGRWAPPIERTKLMAICYAGPYMGNIITLMMSGFLCAKGFDNGWGSIFYVFGGATVLCSLVWFYIVYDSPLVHPRITPKEREFLDEAVHAHTTVKSVPWKSIFTSRPMWAIIVAHFCYNWCNYTLLTVLPLFMKEVLYFDIKTNGMMSSIPYFGQFLGYTFIGPLADSLENKKIMSTRHMRVFLQTISFMGTAAFLIGTSYIHCTEAMVAVALLFFAATFMGFSGGGFFVNHVDIAPSYAGVLFGITNCISALSGFLSPIVAKALTPNGTQHEWQNVFFVCAGFCAFGALFFGIFAGGTIEEWAIEKGSSYDREKKKSLLLRHTSANAADRKEEKQL
ncbi:sialin [Octopus sinensis]|uniref:Sialin n=1 Tax=Octopus sinensis TaxID=2607531 RepID=A0A6P7S472_9MOLL|nr:sialin [Octopus sinensis]